MGGGVFSVQSIWQHEMKAHCSWWRISQTDWIVSLPLIDSEWCTRLLISLKNEFVSWKIEFSSLPLKPQHSAAPANLSALKRVSRRVTVRVKHIRCRTGETTDCLHSTLYLLAPSFVPWSCSWRAAGQTFSRSDAATRLLLQRLWI